MTQSEDASVRTVVVAVAANLLVAVAKGVAAVLTGSAAMLAETTHSIADTANEVLLYVGLRHGAKPADDRHPLGYGQARYFWSLLAAVGIFVIGGLLAIADGVQSLRHPEPLTNVGVGVAVLVVSAGLEGLSWRTAHRQLRAEADARHLDLGEYLAVSSDPTPATVFLEDSAALVGLALALVALVLHLVTGSAVWDGAASLLIGLLLIVVALVLMRRNLALLIDEAAPADVRERLRQGVAAGGRRGGGHAGRAAVASARIRSGQEVPLAAEPPLRVERREELVWLLVQAAELEHGLMCEYLFAQYTLKRSRDEGLSGEQLATVGAWEQVLIGVIKQEMLHLALTTNLLTAIGAAPHLHRPNFPILSRWYPPGVRIALVPFGERALRHFIYLERPEGIDLADAEGFAAVGQAQPLTSGDELMAVPEDYQTVGHLYRGIEHGLERLVQRHGEVGVFIGPPRAQATTEVFEWPELTAVTGLASAKAAIELIVEQGEGARGDWRNAHFGKFIALLQDYQAARAADPAFEPARPVEPAYVRRPPDVEAEVATIGDPLTAQVADLFNAVYETTLQALSRYFVHSGETDDQVEVLARTAKHLMNRVMRPLGSILTTLPLGPERPGVLAGPAFEIVQPSFYVLPHRQAAWRILAERLEELADRAERLRQTTGLGPLTTLHTELHTMAHDVQTA